MLEPVEEGGSGWKERDPARGVDPAGAAGLHSRGADFGDAYVLGASAPWGKGTLCALGPTPVPNSAHLRSFGPAPVRCRDRQ